MSEKTAVRGGYKRRLAQAQQDEAEEQAPSKLSSLLIEQWAWGALSAPKVQAIAEAACADGLSHPDVEKLSKMGSAGKHAGNCHRDLLLIAGNHSLTNAVSSVPIRLKVKKVLSEPVTLDFLLPHKLFSLMFHSLPEAFKACMLGGE